MAILAYVPKEKEVEFSNEHKKSRNEAQYNRKQLPFSQADTYLKNNWRQSLLKGVSNAIRFDHSG